MVLEDEYGKPLMTPGEVARIFRVDPKTVIRWAKDGKIDYVKTLGGHHRFSEEQVRDLLRRNTSLRRAI